MENPPFWWYLPERMGIFYGHVSLLEGTLILCCLAFFLHLLFTSSWGSFPFLVICFSNGLKSWPFTLDCARSYIDSEWYTNMYICIMYIIYACIYTIYWQRYILITFSLHITVTQSFWSDVETFNYRFPNHLWVSVWSLPSLKPT